MLAQLLTTFRHDATGFEHFTAQRESHDDGQCVLDGFQRELGIEQAHLYRHDFAVAVVLTHRRASAACGVQSE